MAAPVRKYYNSNTVNYNNNNAHDNTNTNNNNNKNNNNNSRGDTSLEMPKSFIINAADDKNTIEKKKKMQKQFK